MATYDFSGETNDVTFPTTENNSGNDSITGGSGNDTLDGGPGNDTVKGGDGNDSILGSAGNDKLYGEGGNDTLDGGDGNDELWGGPGNDVLTGGPGNDTFGFSFTFGGSSGGGSAPKNFAGFLADATLGGGSFSISTLSQSDFVHEYRAYLNYLVDGWLKDLYNLTGGADGVIEVGFHQNDPNGAPKIEGMTAAQISAVFKDADDIWVLTGSKGGTQERYYADIDAGFNWGGGESDLITDFTRAGGGSNDNLRFDFTASATWADDLGLANQAQQLSYLEGLFAIEAIDTDSNTVNDSTKISYGDWSVTFAGVYTAAQVWDFTTIAVNGDTIG